jgi:hypothetical protein
MPTEAADSAVARPLKLLFARGCGGGAFGDARANLHGVPRFAAL